MKLPAVALANLEELCSKEKVAILHERRDGESSWDGVQMQFLWPDPGADESAAAPKNDDSLVMRLKYGERAFLLPGDAERQAERTMVHQAAAGALRADVLKVGHHGSKHSTTPDFLAAVTPSVAVISAGEENPYGHPNAELLERLAAARIRILRTDHDGAVQILTDGKNLEVNCFVACPETGSRLASTNAQPPNHQ